MIKILLALLALLLFVTCTTLAKADRKADVVDRLSNDCTIVSKRMHNSFASIKMNCGYEDNLLSGYIKKTLYVSSNGYVIKAWR